MFEYAQRIVAIRGNPLALCIPFTLFALSCYYVFGGLEALHGARPSERHFIGVIPMLTSTNLAIQLLRARRLKGRVLFGADYPLFTYERLVADWRSLDYSEEILQKLFVENATALFPQLALQA